MDIKNHTPNCDVFSATDMSHLPILKEKGELAEYAPANATSLLPAFQSLSDPGWSYITNASRYFLIYNKDLANLRMHRNPGWTFWTRAGRVASQRAIPRSAAAPAPGL
jgi:ABC-type Fe3+ transport system substrate-binding protein